MKFKNKNTKLFLVLGASTLALGSIGFASWIIGVQQKEATSNLQVTVDTASVSNIKVDYQMSNKKVDIKETTEQEEGSLIKPTEVNQNALQFTFEKITVQVGTGVAENERPKKLKISLPTELNANNIVKSKELNKIQVNHSSATKYRTDAEGEENNFTYLEYENEITLDYESKDTGFLTKTDNYFTFTITTLVNEKFTLGTYFDYVGGTPEATNPETSVSEFYNTIYKDYNRNDKVQSDFLMIQADNIKTELDGMHAALNKENALTLKIELLNQ